MSPREETGDAAGEIRKLVPDIETLALRLADFDYLVDEGLATSMFLSLRLPQPLLLEGEAGGGTPPEIGTIRATHPPIIVLTSNRTRDLHDAVKRRCLYHRISYPTPQREVEIVRRRVKGSSEILAVQVANAVSRMRSSDVQKPPGIAEAIDWLAALSLLGIEALDAAAVDRTLGSVLKYSDDQEVIRAAGLEQLVRSGDCPGCVQGGVRSRDD